MHLALITLLVVGQSSLKLHDQDMLALKRLLVLLILEGKKLLLSDAFRANL